MDVLPQLRVWSHASLLICLTVAHYVQFLSRPLPLNLGDNFLCIRIAMYYYKSALRDEWRAMVYAVFDSNRWARSPLLACHSLAGSY